MEGLCLEAPEDLENFGIPKEIHLQVHSPGHPLLFVRSTKSAVDYPRISQITDRCEKSKTKFLTGILSVHHY